MGSRPEVETRRCAVTQRKVVATLLLTPRSMCGSGVVTYTMRHGSWLLATALGIVGFTPGVEG